MDSYFAVKAIVSGVAALALAGVATMVPDVGWYPPTLFGVLSVALVAGGVYILAVPRKERLSDAEDGHRQDYVTLAPEQQDQGDLVGIPRVYIHQRCGAGTRMPEQIIRSYLKDSFIYYSDSTFCTGCKGPVPDRECVWRETGENLQAYMERLRAENPDKRPGFIKRIYIGILNLIG